MSEEPQIRGIKNVFALLRKFMTSQHIVPLNEICADHSVQPHWLEGQVW